MSPGRSAGGDDPLVPAQKATHIGAPDALESDTSGYANHGAGPTPERQTHAVLRRTTPNEYAPAIARENALANQGVNRYDDGALHEVCHHHAVLLHPEPAWMGETGGGAASHACGRLGGGSPSLVA